MYKHFLSVAALVASALALPTITDAPKNIQAGQSYTITWTPSTTSTGPITLQLKQGPNDNLATVATIASGLTGTTYTWVVPATYPNGGYAIEIIQGTEMNYWGGVTYSGGTAAAVSAAPAASSLPVASAVITSAASTTSLVNSAASNGTSMTSSTSSRSSSSRSSSTSSIATATATITSSNSAIALGSPIALILSAFAAMLYLQ